jgi:transcriptional regulator with XRE-family HTH domain
MDFGQKLVQLRKQQHLSREELGRRVGTSGAIIGRYERGEMMPSVEIAARLADALAVSLDYLAGKTSLEFDQATLKRMEEVSLLPADAKQQIFLVMDALIRDFKAKKAYAS